MLFTRRHGARRNEARKNRLEASSNFWKHFNESGMLASAFIAAAFFVLASAILVLRERVVSYRPGQFVSQDIRSRVIFSKEDPDLRSRLLAAVEREPRIYMPNHEGDPWTALEHSLLQLPDLVKDKTIDQIPQELRDQLQIRDDDHQVLTYLYSYADPTQRGEYEQAVREYVARLRKLNLVIIPADQLRDEQESGRAGINIDTNAKAVEKQQVIDNQSADANLVDRLTKAALPFRALARSALVHFTLATLRPTHELDSAATNARQEAKRAEIRRHPEAWSTTYAPGGFVVSRSTTIGEREWQLLRAEKDAYIKSLGNRVWKMRLGMAGIVLLITAVMCFYIGRYQPKVMRNHARAIAIAALLLATLLVAQLAAIGTGPLYFFGLAPTLFVAMILTIVYDQRFGLGMATMHAMLVTAALDQGIAFFTILWIGSLTACFLLDEVRTRSKLIEVGGAAAVSMMIAALAAGALSMDSRAYALKNCYYAGAAALGVGFIILGILPFIERFFRITTAMTLLELADASQPVLRRLALEAPGTYNHSLQVATLAEAAAESIGCNSLLCRVASYYHDIGKINKADYFVENQSDGRNRHLNLSPSVSILIILGHVKDGVEMAKEYGLPTILIPFIQQHHGTMLIEYFYHQACMKNDQDDVPAISETQYRYPGPKPRSRETAVVMLADCVESAVRAMQEPTPARIESLVHELALKRLLDGQFNECDLTLKDLEQAERACIKTLMGIYHGRLAYPSTAATTAAPAPVMTVKTA